MEHAEDKDEMEHAEDKDEHGGRGINHICLLFVRGPWSLCTEDLRSSGTWDSIAVSPFPPGVAPTKVGMGSPCPHALTRSSSLDSISVGPLGPGGPTRPWVTMTMLVTLAAARERPATLAAPLMALAAGRPHGMARHSTVRWDLAAKFGHEVH